MKHMKSEKGMFTVEMVLIFIVSIATLIFFIYLGIVMYQHVHLQSVTDRIASRGAMMYTTRTVNMKTAAKSLESFWQCDPYRYINDNTYRNNAESAIRSALDDAMGTGNVLVVKPGEGASANVSLKIFRRRVEVSGKRTFNLPFNSLFNKEDSFFNIDVESKAYIMDMPETIRNVDYIADMLNQNQQVRSVIAKVGTFKTNITDFISKIGQ